MMENFSLSKLSTNTLLVEILLDKLTDQQQKMFFGKSIHESTALESIAFVQEEDFVFEKNTLLFLGLDTRFQFLKKGKYPLKKGNSKLTVTLTLSEN